MNKTTTKLSYEEHCKLGLNLAKCRDRLISLVTKDCEGMSVHHIVRKRALQAVRAIDLLRVVLEGQLFRLDHPDVGEFEAYYPTSDHRKETSFSW
jgi:hypothetical protein